MSQPTPIEKRICAAPGCNTEPRRWNTECSRHAHMRQRYGAYELPPRTCRECGSGFQPKRHNHQFCCKNCQLRHNSRIRARAKAARDHGTKITYACLDCGTALYRIKGVLGGSAKRCANCAYLRKRPYIIERNKLRKGAQRGSYGKLGKRDWERTVARFRGKCAYCKVRDYEHIDHVVPIARGGTNTIGNVLPACASCNLSKGSKLLVEWRYGP